MIRCNSLLPIRRQIADEIETATLRVLNSGWFVLGPEVETFEREFARYHNVNFAIGVANGTDAIELALRAGDIGAGDEVITVAHTAVATVCAIERAGAIPVLVDINPVDYTIDPAACRAAINSRTKAIVAVHLYGQPADLVQLTKLADQHRLLLIEDCAQAHGAQLSGRLVGTFGQMGAFSFYPTKNLGAYGDGGAIITNDADLAARLKRLRFYGQADRYKAVERGVNSRLDELQAAILSVKLKYLDESNKLRRQNADFYNRFLSGVGLPHLRHSDSQSIQHVYHQYVIRHDNRDAMKESLRQSGVETLIHYPIPVHQQPAYSDLKLPAGSLPVSERVSSEILSLPIVPGLSEVDLRNVADAVNAFVKNGEYSRAA